MTAKSACRSPSKRFYNPSGDSAKTRGLRASKDISLNPPLFFKNTKPPTSVQLMRSPSGEGSVPIPN